MDIVRIYYNSIDVQPHALLHHFLRFLGFYVDERTDGKEPEDIQSVVDIHIISDAYVQSDAGECIYPNSEKTIFILKDGWKLNDGVGWVINYAALTQDVFLFQLTEIICEIIGRNRDGAALLMRSGVQWKKTVRYITNKYIEHDMFESVVLTRCLYRKNSVIDRESRRYRAFVNDLSNVMDTLFESDLIRYTALCAQYEFDMVCKRNLLELIYSPAVMLEECEALLEYYVGNEELYLLKADILFELQNKWVDACDEYANEHIAQCAYANYKRGKIFGTLLKEYENAGLCLRYALQKKEDYCYAWYQLGECYEAGAKYASAIEAFEKVYDILKENYSAHLLEPLELEYMYKSVMKIAAIYKTRLNDYGSAHMYSNHAKLIWEEHAFDRYIDHVLEIEDGQAKASLLEEIDDAAWRQVNFVLEEIY